MSEPRAGEAAGLPEPGLAARRATRASLGRLTSASDFERVRRDGKSHAHPLVVLVARKRGPDEGAGGGPVASLPDVSETVTPAPVGTRVGVVAGRSVGNAVKRNRAKRLLREAMRAYRAQLADGWDVMLIARAPLAGVKLKQAQAAVGELLKRARLVAK